MPYTEEYLTTGEAASLLSVSPITIRRWVKSGRLEGRRVGHFTVVLRGDIEAIVDDLREGQ